MALGGKIMELFGRNHDGSQPAPMQPTSATPASVVANATVPGGEGKSDGNGPAAFPKAGEGSQSPMENFKDLWQTSDKDGALKSPVPNLQADPKKLAEASRNIDFMAMVDAGTIAKASAGDQQAMMQVVNQVGQAGIAQAAAIATEITRSAITELTKNNETFLAESLRRNTVSTELRSDPSQAALFENPAVAPMLKMVEDRMVSKYPQASAAQVNQMAKDYLTEFVDLAAMAQGREVRLPPKESRLKKPDLDWDKWASEF